MTPRARSIVRLGYAVIATGAILVTVAVLEVGGTRGYVLAALNLSCVATAIVCVRVLRRVDRSR